jgi:hypothetical protein
MAGPEGIEPSFSVLETDVLPLNYGPIFPAKVWYMEERFFAIFASLYLTDKHPW